MGRLDFKALNNNKLFITGHTGFKGTWLGLLSRELGLETVGFALPPEPDSLYSSLGESSVDESIFSDIRNLDALNDAILKSEATILIHLAAQPLVLQSYDQPLETFETNIMGTANVLEAASNSPSMKSILVITTDKVYRNNNSGEKFVETNPLEGSDPYSASKVGVEAVSTAWRKMNRRGTKPKIIVARAGNVIGGGDLSKDRLIPDLIRGKMNNHPVVIRNSSATRPWQHVLDPLMGYLLYLNSSLSAEVPDALNFGPGERSKSVAEVLEISKQYFALSIKAKDGENIEKKEAVSLDLDSSLAFRSLNWVPRWTQDEAVKKTLDWWVGLLDRDETPLALCKRDITEFLE